MERVDEAYEAKMLAFEIDCNDGKGEPQACHHVGEFYSVVKDQHDRSAKIYDLNCNNKGYGPSCFNLARLYRKSLVATEMSVRLLASNSY
jgi:hypothetical protein